MDSPATIEHLTGRGLAVGEGPGETPRNVATTRLDEAWRALRAELRLRGVDIAAAAAADDDVKLDAGDVVAQAAMRVLRNPGGVESESAGIDDWQEARKFVDTSQDVYFTAAELRRLTPDAPAATAGSMKYS